MKSNLFYSILGVIFQTLFPLIIYPYVTRVLGVAGLGEYNFYASTVGYLALFSGFGISLYGTREIGRLKNDRTAYSQVFAELVSLNLILCVFVYLFIFLLLILSESYHNVKLFLITSITIVGNAIGAEYLFVALEKQRFMFVRNVCFKILSLFLIFMYVRDENDLLTYAFIMLISTAGVSLTNIIGYKSKIDWVSINIRKINYMPHMIPLVQVFIMDAMNHYYGTMDIVILGNLDTVESVGLYSIASKIFYLSYTFLASTAVPLLPRASYYIENKLVREYESMVRRCYDVYLLIILFISFLLFIYAEDIIVLVSGDEFRLGYKSLRIFSLTLLPSSFCNLFIFEVLYPKNKNKFVLNALLVSIIINIICSIVLVYFASFIGVTVAFFISYVILFLIFLVRGKEYLPQYNGYKDLIKEIMGVVICFVLFIIMQQISVFFAIQMIICSIVYVFVELLLGNETAVYLKDILYYKLKERFIES